MVYGFLQLHLFWISNCIYAACLSMKAKRSNQSKAPSTNKHCFLFALSPFSPVLYLLVFEFSIVIVNHVKELGPFIDLCIHSIFKSIPVVFDRNEHNNKMLYKLPKKLYLCKKIPSLK